MINQVPRRPGRKLTTPFELVRGVKPDSSTWFELFSACYWSQSVQYDIQRLKVEDHSLDGTVARRKDISNKSGFYNPLPRSYYRPLAFRFNEGCLPVTDVPQYVRYSEGLTCGMIRNRRDTSPEPFHPGTQVTITEDDTPVRCTIQNVPMQPISLLSTAADPHPKQEDAHTQYIACLDRVVLLPWLRSKT